MPAPPAQAPTTVAAGAARWFPAVAAVGLHAVVGAALVLLPQPQRPPPADRAHTMTVMLVPLAAPVTAPTETPPVEAPAVEAVRPSVREQPRPPPPAPQPAGVALARPEADPVPMPAPKPLARPVPRPASEVPPSPPQAVAGGTEGQPHEDPAPAPAGAQPVAVAWQPAWTLGGRFTPAPVYPVQARRSRMEGRVVLRVRVLPPGAVADVHVIESSGWPLLDREALETVRRWRFEPAPAGVTDAAVVTVPIAFRLR